MMPRFPINVCASSWLSFDVSAKMFRLITIVLFLTLPRIALGDDFRPSALAGHYTHPVPGSTTVLDLASTGDYTLSTYATFGGLTNPTEKEEGTWKFDGWAVVLEPVGKADVKKSDLIRRRLFPIESESGGRYLVSGLRRFPQSDEYHFHFMFMKDGGMGLPEPEESEESFNQRPERNAR